MCMVICGLIKIACNNIIVYRVKVGLLSSLPQQRVMLTLLKCCWGMVQKWTLGTGYACILYV